MKSALVIGNGELSVPLSSEFAQRFDIVVAVDGAFNHVPADVRVDYVCGDLDSVTLPQPSNPLSKTVVVELPSQESNDLEKTLLWLQGIGVGRVVIVNIWGGRIDHTLAALSILLRFHSEFEMVLYSEKTAIRILSNEQEISIQSQKGDGVSLSVFNECSCVTLTGVQWPLNAEVLYPGSRGVSNVANGDTIALSVHSGVVVLTHWMREESFALRTL